MTTAVKQKPTIFGSLKLQPQTRKILAHLNKRGSISPMEALVTYGCFRLAAQIFKLRQVGYNIVTDVRKDNVAHQYARYVLRKN
ncbi:MAG: helix-turn-helix domain-containing protein [Thiothrix sp.]|uniref:helix-turn-helix domain-containing protein n=1 Tax=Thiothrix sp. TaxID=1032 RepID=UPI002615FAD2|nr:helix-turn-helix domain-containing protein [Thiothrix sp.]MDD5395283.1 helix-turn-helix domain-containing protein [Thiothrix sp.]